MPSIIPSFALACGRLLQAEPDTEVLALLAQGLTNQAIAERLVLSQKTVRNHASNICSLLQMADRAEVIIRARDAGLGAES
ncbi:MAG: LuxR C-terminal-related transcriptional regulator [Anaerolineae bacterium]